jgi:hypothetical protein
MDSGTVARFGMGSVVGTIYYGYVYHILHVTRFDFPTVMGSVGMIVATSILFVLIGWIGRTAGLVPVMGSMMFVSSLIAHTVTPLIRVYAFFPCIGLIFGGVYLTDQQDRERLKAALVA